MGTVESWTNFERHNGGIIGARERFEVFCAELLDLENPGLEVHQIAANPGDDGIDVLVSHPDGMDIYQCKYFRDPLKDIQWKQIRDSYNTAVQKNTNIHSWYLCLPRQLTKPEIERWNAFKKEHNACGFTIEIIDGNQLISRAENQGISEKWFSPCQFVSTLSQENIRVQIWKASKRYYGILCSGNNKFGGLKIFESLFPNGIYRDVYYEPLAVNREGRVTPVQEIFQEHVQEHLVLMGEGGIGKTTFLAHQLSVLLKEKEQMPDMIPVYVELNRCPNVIGQWYSSKYGKTNYITRYVKSIMDDGEFESYTSEQLSDIEKEFMKETESPQYLLLLDGFNEINTMQADGTASGQSVRELLRNEIEQLARFTNVRIILTTRRMSENYLPDGFNYVALQGLETENIRDYLTHADYSDTDIAWIEAHTELLDCLRIPLFLCMFACRNKAEKIKPLTRGEILYHFFHRGTPFYSEKGKMKHGYTDDVQLKKMLMYTMDFILPTVGYHMNDRGIFQLTKADLLKEIERSFGDAILSKQVTEIPAFSEYESETESLADLKEQLCRISSKRYLDIIVNILGVMNRNGVSGYSFVHHHIRDYFAAYYIVQRMREALALYHHGKNTHTQSPDLDDNDGVADNIRHCLEPVFYEIPDETIQSFIGEILGEHRNTPVLDAENHWHIPAAAVPEQTMLRQILDLYRYSPIDPQYLIRNVVEIIKKVRKTVAGENFDGLDLRQCRFYETICSAGTGDSCLAASFRNCKITDRTFLFEGHIGSYTDFVIPHSNSDRILTLGDDDQVCLWDRETHRMLSSFIVGSAIAQEGHDPDKKIAAGSAQTFLVRFYDDTEEGRRTYIEYVRGEEGEMLLTGEKEERVIDDIRFSPFGTYICGVWGGDTVRLFSSVDGDMRYSYVYTGPGRICHVAMPRENQIILHVKLSEEIVTKKAYRPSEWEFLRLDMECDRLQKIYQYETCRAFDTPTNEPMSVFDDCQTKCLIHSGKQLIILDLENGEKVVLDEFSEEIIPERGEFLGIEGSKVSIYWDDTIKLYDIEQKKASIHRNLLLKQCKAIHMADHNVYVIDENGRIHEWNLETDTILENVFPTVRLDIRKIHADISGHILVEYDNNCILTIDEASDCLLSTFYDVDPESDVEICTYLEQSNQFFIVLHCPDYEQILLYDPISGKRERVKVTFKSQLKYRAVLEENHMLYIAFDKKMIVLDMDSGQQKEIWHAHAGETFFDFHVKDGMVYLLLQWVLICRMPLYYVFAQNSEDNYEQIGTASVLYVTEKEFQNILLDRAGDMDIEFFVKDPVKEKDIGTARGIFLNPSLELRQKYSLFEAIPEESTRVFFYVEDYGRYVRDIIGESAFVEQNNHMYLTILKDYMEVCVYCKNGDGEFEQKYMFTPCGQDDECLSLYHVAMGAHANAYCSTSDEKLIKVNPENGEILKKFSWLPGIILTGCDFAGTEISEYLRNILAGHGAKMNVEVHCSDNSVYLL